MRLTCSLALVLLSYGIAQAQTAESELARGEALDEAGNWNAAREAFEHALQSKPNYGQAHLDLGLVYLQLKQQAPAAGELDRAIQLLGSSPEGGFGLYLRAKIYSQQNQTEKARRALNRAVGLRPDLAEAWSDLGQARKLAFDDAGALAAFKKAVELKPDDAVAQYRLGAEYLHEVKAHLAVEHLHVAYRRNPHDQSTLNALQSALRQDGQAGEADRVKQELAQLLRERDRASQNAVAAVQINNEGANLEKAGDLRGAADKYSKALELDPEHVGIRVNYAVALLRIGEWTRGLNELHEALQRDPNNENIRAALEDALAQAPPDLVPKWPK